MKDINDKIIKLEKEKDRLIIALGIAIDGFGDDCPGPSYLLIYEVLDGKDPGNWRAKHLEANIRQCLRDAKYE